MNKYNPHKLAVPLILINGTIFSVSYFENPLVNRVHLIKTYKQPQQEIYHGATESNTINNTNKKANIYPAV